jgi:hypothetical protein
LPTWVTPTTADWSARPGGRSGCQSTSPESLLNLFGPAAWKGGLQKSRPFGVQAGARMFRGDGAWQTEGGVCRVAQLLASFGEKSDQFYFLYLFFAIMRFERRISYLLGRRSAT